MRTSSASRLGLPLLLGAALALAACGQKGPLYHPEPAATPAPPVEKDKDERKDASGRDGADRPAPAR